MKGGDDEPRVPEGTRADDIQWVARQESGRARAAITLLAIVGFIEVLWAVSNTAQLFLLEAAAAGTAVSPADASANDDRQQVIAIGYLIALLVSAIVFLRWFHLAVKNARDYRAGRWMTFTPSNAVWSFFIPIRNLVQPYKIMNELVEASDPLDLPEPPPRIEHVPTATYRERALEERAGAPADWKRSLPLGLWWCGWIASNVIGTIASKLENGESVKALLFSTEVSILSDVLTVGAALLAIVVVRGVDARRQEVFRRLAAHVDAAGGQD